MYDKLDYISYILITFGIVASFICLYSFYISFVNKI